MSKPRRAAELQRYVPGPRPPLTPAAAGEMAQDAGANTAILVEGWSDQAAIDTLARRRGFDLRADGILTVPIGGVSGLGAFVRMLGPAGFGLELTGLCDAGEEKYARRTLERAGVGTDLTRDRLEAVGFFVCEADLEDELIRALAPSGVQGLLEAQGELDSFRRFQGQPAQRGRSLTAQLRRFLGTRARRKVRYGSLLVEAVDLTRVPRPLEQVLGHARSVAGREAT